MAQDRMFKSRSVIAARVTKLLDSYAQFAVNHVDAQLNNPMFTPRATEMRALKMNTEAYVKTARSLMADPDFATELTPDEQEDVRAIAEEAEAAIADIDAIADPDVVWTKMNRSHKLTATETQPMNRTQLDKIRGRLMHEIRKQTPQPADPRAVKSAPVQNLTPEEREIAMRSTYEENMGRKVQKLGNDEAKEMQRREPEEEPQSPPYTSPENSPEAPLVVDETILERNKREKKKAGKED